MPTPVKSFRIPLVMQKDVAAIVNALKQDPNLVPEVLDTIQRASAKGKQGRNRVSRFSAFQSEEAAMYFLVRRLKADLRPEAIFLIAGDLIGRPGLGVDFGFLVVFDEGDPDSQDYHVAYQPVSGCGLWVDVAPCSTEDFEQGRGEPGTTAYVAERYGKLVYARPQSDFRDHFRGGGPKK